MCSLCLRRHHAPPSFTQQELPPLSLGFVLSVFETASRVLSDAKKGLMPLDTCLAWLFGHWLLVEVRCGAFHVCVDAFEVVRTGSRGFWSRARASSVFVVHLLEMQRKCMVWVGTSPHGGLQPPETCGLARKAHRGRSWQTYLELWGGQRTHTHACTLLGLCSKAGV